MLKGKNAVIYGAGGDIGGAVARAFAREGAKLFLSGRTLGPIKALASEIVGRGGVAEAAQVDALDEQAVERYVGSVVEKAGAIDISFCAISVAKELTEQGAAAGAFGARFRAADCGLHAVQFPHRAQRRAPHGRKSARA